VCVHVIMYLHVIVQEHVFLGLWENVLYVFLCLQKKLFFVYMVQWLENRVLLRIEMINFKYHFD